MSEPQIVLSCISPDARECLEQAMEQWPDHHERIKHTGHRCEDDRCVYSFAYWLIRYSGLVTPTQGEVR